MYKGNYMRFLTANYVYPVSTAPVENGVLVTEDNGRIVSLLRPGDVGYAATAPNAQHFEGILTPGFVNAHCHLELSYLKGKIVKHTGLSGFVKEMMTVRKWQADEEVLGAIEDAENEMLRNGIVAVGDISNSDFTFAQKAKRNLLYHTFIELFGLNADKAEEVFANGETLLRQLEELLPSAPANITPHATYSLSNKLLKLIAEHNYLRDGVISIHNQETEGENELFRTGTGPIAEQMAKFGLDLSTYKPTGFNSLPSTVVHLPNCNRILLVHNTVTTQADVQWAMDYGKMMYWALCPNANLYIENKLPDVPMLRQMGAKIVVGTDSYASNDSLSILDELKTIAANFPETPTAELVQWATLNGAEALGFKLQLGALDKGKTPGINHITVDERGEIFGGSLVTKLA
jgi:cytosine/adenosine deaminase-related metal-dependent hydrolase